MKKTLFLTIAVFVLTISAASAQAAAPVLTRVISNTSFAAIANGMGSPYAIAVGHSPINLRAYFYLRVDGSNFSNAAKIKFGQTLLTPYSRADNRLIAIVRYTSIASPGVRLVQVTNSPPNSNMSNEFLFEVKRRKPYIYGQNQDVNLISGINPGSTRIDHMPPNDSITIRGEGFRNDSRARLRGQNRDTQFISATELIMTLEENDVARMPNVPDARHHSISVYNPDGLNDPFPKGTSNRASFRVGP